MPPPFGFLGQETREVRTPKQNLRLQGDRGTSLAADVESVVGGGLAVQSDWSLKEPDLAEVGGEQGQSVWGRGSWGPQPGWEPGRGWYRLE